MTAAPDVLGHGPLAPRLRAMMALRPEWYRDILTTLAVRLDRAAVPNILQVGETMPQFILPNASGDLVLSSDLHRLGPVVVCFVRGGWCPFCRNTLLALDLIVSRVQAAGATMVALSPDTLGLGMHMQQHLALKFQILSDVDCGVALQFGTAYRVPAEYREALMKLGTNLRQRHGDGPGLLPMPATFVADKNGIIRFAHATGDITERAEPEIVARVVQAVAAAAQDRPGA